jgi:hypothetical protein
MQKFRSAIERVFRVLKRWRGAWKMQIAPFNQESIADHCNKAEKRIDVIVEFENLVLEAKLGMFDKIPKKEHSGHKAVAAGYNPKTAAQ